MDWVGLLNWRKDLDRGRGHRITATRTTTCLHCIGINTLYDTVSKHDHNNHRT